MLREYKQHVIDLGLDEREADIYLYLLTNGSATIDSVAKETKNKRSTAYVHLQNLQKKGLISGHKKGKTVHFIAENPNKLQGYLNDYLIDIEQKRAHAEKLIPELLKQFIDSGARPGIRVYEGKEGMMEMRQEVLNARAKDIYIAISMTHLYKNLSQKELLDFSTTRARKNIKSYVIYTSDREIQSVPPQEMKRVNENDFPFSSDIYIFDEKVAFSYATDRIVGVVIESEIISKSMTSMFKLAWNSL